MPKPSVEKMEKEGESRKYPLNQIYFYLTEGCNLRWVTPILHLIWISSKRSSNRPSHWVSQA
jgi:hypothetical protein